MFLTRYPVEGASSRYRVFQYLPHLRARGLDCTVQSFMDGELYALGQMPGRTLRKAWATLKASWRRIRAVAAHGRYDVVYMQRELLPFGPPVLERWMARRGTPLLFDYDDALFIKKASRYNPLATLLRAPEKTFEIFKLVGCVVAGNNWLRDQALQNGAKRAETVEVAEDTGRIPMRAVSGPSQPVTIGWLGSPSTAKYLHLIGPVLGKLASRHPDLRFELVGSGEFHMEGVPWVLTPWSLQNELDALARFDVGLMPLPLEDWARGKSGGKARTYMAAGVVPVCTGIGYNLELIEHGRTGFLCVDERDWLDILEELVDDAALRRRVAVAARAEVVSRFDPGKQADALASLIQETARLRACARRD
ncbi:glycosyltransferase family 4 protein [Thermomonas sp.]|uniref:glycosyltransferase family 4 protein n=1 Tax=Thermomonas sp. TaxID=1971895 RepID=UPI0026127F01|nr:glycosyltransferase family 4 protein [Thermomonas sp.]MCO5054641.1 glycosyltransferase family 4 protein [Thermomonas sp.]